MIGFPNPFEWDKIRVFVSMAWVRGFRLLLSLIHLNILNMRNIPVQLGSLLKGLVLAVVFGVILMACTSNDELGLLERRTQALNKVIVCPVCPGESIDQSQNKLAGQMRDIVAEKIGEGWTDEQIMAFFAERYGPSVLMEPQRNGFSLVVWILPLIVVPAAGLALYLVLRLMRISAGRQFEERWRTVGLSEEERTAYVARIEAALNQGRDTVPIVEEVNGNAERSEGLS